MKETLPEMPASWTVREATEYVRRVEADHINLLYDEMEEACTRAKGCGCNSCKHQAEYASEDFWNEVERVEDPNGEG